MGYFARMQGGLKWVDLGSLDLTSTNETKRAIMPSGLTVDLLQGNDSTQVIGPADVWVPVGVSYVITTGITVTDAVVTLWYGTAAADATSGAGVATLSIASSGANELFAAFSDYTYPTIAAGGTWSVKVTTTSTAGVVNPVHLWYFNKAVKGINDATTNV